MTWFLFFGDILVMAGLATLAAWLYARPGAGALEEIARIPLEDECAGDSGTADHGRRSGNA